MGTELHTFQGLSVTARPDAFARGKPTVIFNHTFQPDRSIVKFLPVVGGVDTDGKVYAADVHLPVNTARIAPSQFDYIASADGCESNLEIGVVAPNYHVVTKIATTAHDPGSLRPTEAEADADPGLFVSD